MVNVMVVHERDRWKATDVDIQGSISEDSKELVKRAREYLKQTDYQTYVFVTQYPDPDPNSKRIYCEKIN